MITHIYDNICIGDIDDARSQSGVAFSHIDVRNLNFELEELIETRIRLQQALDKITEYAHRQSRPVLVYCQAGMERSPFVVALWLWATRTIERTFEEVYDFVAYQRPQTIKHMEWRKRIIIVPTVEIW